MVRSQGSGVSSWSWRMELEKGIFQFRSRTRTLDSNLPAPCASRRLVAALFQFLQCVFGRSIPLLSRLAVPFSGLNIVLRHALAVDITQGEVELRRLGDRPRNCASNLQIFVCHSAIMRHFKNDTLGTGPQCRQQLADSGQRSNLSPELQLVRDSPSLKLRCAKPGTLAPQP